MSGFDAFRTALPEPLLRLADPGGSVADDAVRQALALATGWLLLALLVRIGLRTGSWLWHRWRHEAAVQTTSPPLTWGRRAAGLLSVLLPWLGLVALHESGRLDDLWFRGSYFCGCVWLLLRAADHHRVLVDVGRDTVVSRHGLAVGPLETQVWPVVTVLSQADGQALPPASTRPRGLAVVPRRAGWQHLVAVLGGEKAADAWLREALRALTLKPAADWRVRDDA